MRIRIRVLAIVAAAASVAGVITASVDRSAEAAVPATIPLQITNNSGRGDAVYIYNLGTNLATGQQGWADAAGNFHAWPAGGNPPTPAPDASIAGPGQRAVDHDPDAEVLRPRLLLVRTEAGLQADHRRPGAARRTESERSEPQHPVQLVGVHAQRLRAVDQQHPGRHVLRAVRRRSAGSPTAAPRPPVTSKAGGYNDFYNALRGQPGGWAEPDPDGTGRFGTARALADVRRRDRCAPGERDGRLREPGVGEVQHRDAHGHAVRRPAEHQVLRSRLRQRHELHQQLGRRRHLASRSRTRTASSAATSCSTHPTTRSAGRSRAPCAPATTAPPC